MRLPLVRLVPMLVAIAACHDQPLGLGLTPETFRVTVRDTTGTTVSSGTITLQISDGTRITGTFTLAPRIAVQGSNAVYGSIDHSRIGLLLGPIPPEGALWFDGVLGVGSITGDWGYYGTPQSGSGRRGAFVAVIQSDGRP